MAANAGRSVNRGGRPYGGFLPRGGRGGFQSPGGAAAFRGGRGGRGGGGTNSYRGRGGGLQNGAKIGFQRNQRRWAVVVAKPDVPDDTIQEFLMGIKYKLQQKSYRFQLTTEKRVLINELEIENIYHRLLEEKSKSNDSDLVFCIIVVESKRIAVDFQDHLDAIDIPCIFVLNFENEDISGAAKEIIEKTSADISENGEENGSSNFSRPASDVRPMNERTVSQLAQETSKTDEEILLKLTSDGSFLRRMQIPTQHLDVVHVLRLVSRGCQCNASHYRRSLNELLDKFCTSEFWKTTLPQDLIKCQQDAANESTLMRNQFRIQQILNYTLTILKELLRSVQNRANESMVIKTLLFNVLNMRACKSNRTVYNAEMQNLQEAVDVLFEDIVNRSVLVQESNRNAQRPVIEQRPPNNFRDLPIFPTTEEIITHERPFLRANIIRGAYESVDHYLDVQYRLLREDYIDALRKGITELQTPPDSRGGGGKRRLEVKVYENVTIIPPEQDKRSGFLTYKLQFPITKNLKRVRWEISKRFLHGSLICLSMDNFKSICFATVYDRKPEDLRKGQLSVIFELLPDGKLSYKDSYVMVESSAYFEAYRHVLQALRSIRDERDMPFVKYFIKCDPRVEAPMYLRQGVGQLELDLSCLVNSDDEKAKLRSRFCNILLPSTWPTKEELRLDQSQYDALKLALTKELAVIQGPPGTGKTFIGYKIAQVLLENEHCWQSAGDSTPILVVCYTNHALDQFLEGINGFLNEGIIRVGGRSKNEAMEKFLLRNVKTSYDLPGDLRYRLRQEHMKKNTIEHRITNLSNNIGVLDKAPLNYVALGEVFADDKRLYNQLFANPNKLTVSKNLLLNIWLTSNEPVQTQGLPIDINVVRQLMAVTQFDQVPCMNAAFIAKSDFTRAQYLLFQLQQDQRLYVPLPHVQNVPGLFFVDEIVQQLRCDEKDALFALQQNNNDLTKAMQFLTDGYQIVEDERIADAAVEAEAKEAEEDVELLAEMANLDDDNRHLIEDDIESFNEEDFGMTYVDPVQEWQSVDKSKNVVPARVWQLIVKSKPLSNVEYIRIGQIANVWQLPLQHRWRLYRTWVEMYRSKVDLEIRQQQQRYFEVTEQIREIRSLEQRHIFKQAKVLGMTTTGAAKYQSVLNAVKPKIVIIEEAAEVLESHIVTSLSAGCQQVVLIGDHFQLRPNPAVYDLAKRYNFDISLFERLIENKFDHAVLKQQHRMRPEIADTLMPYFYDGLENHDSVNLYPDVKGLSKNIFFFHHTHPEVQEGDSTSRQNEFEAKMIVGLCKYLLQQEYKQDDITILCCYAGQMFCIKKLLKEKMLEAEYKSLRVTVVDNYQGEECKIILLSFVRSNNEQKIGFLKTKNRVCVALSRAKHGLYCFGNFSHLAQCSPELWGEIVENLKRRGFYGEALPLRCQIHGKEVGVKKLEDFHVLVPEGGCRELCNFRMDCGHVCKKFCHPNDADHVNVRCVSECQRPCPDKIHVCKKMCWQQCGDCKIQVDRTLPLCGHVNKAPCFKALVDIRCQHPCKVILTCGHKCQETCDPAIHTTKCKEKVVKTLTCGHHEEVCCHESVTDVKCQRKVQKTWPFCGHVNETVCSVNVHKEKCPQKCPAVLDCEHLCTGTCDSCNNGRLHVNCVQDCKKALICGHECDQKCSKACPPCEKLCEIRCPHSSCVIQHQSGGKKGSQKKGKGRKCGLPCPPCTEKCSWKCRHFECTKLCSEPCDRPKCMEPCDQMLKCKHPCLGMCGEPCPQVCAQCPEDAEKYEAIKSILFGNEDDPQARFVQLADCKHVFEVNGFDSWVKSKVEQMSSEERVEIKLLDCPHCRAQILTSLRYGNEVKKILADVQGVKQKIQGDPKELNKLRATLVEDLKDLQKNTTFSDPHNAGYVFCKNYERLLEAIEKPQVNQLTNDSIVRLTNMVGFIRQLTEIELLVERLLALGIVLQGIDELVAGGLRRVGETLVTVRSPVLKQFLSQWFPHWFESNSFVAHQIERKRLVEFVQFEISKLLQLIGVNYKTASAQMMNEISNELSRLRFLLQFASILNLLLDRDVESECATMLNEAITVLYGKRPFDSVLTKKTKELLKRLHEKSHLGGLGITESERKDIINAMGMTQGHWYKCRNGHVYCITECGGAMQESKCPECHESIGGVNHALVSGNTVATEMDGATRGAFEAAIAGDGDLAQHLARLDMEDFDFE